MSKGVSAGCEEVGALGVLICPEWTFGGGYMPCFALI